MSTATVQMSAVFPGRVILKPSFRKFRTPQPETYSRPKEIDFSKKVIKEKKNQESEMSTEATNSLFASVFQSVKTEKKTVKVDYSKFKITKRSKQPTAQSSAIDDITATLQALSI